MFKIEAFDGQIRRESNKALSKTIVAVGLVAIGFIGAKNLAFGNLPNVFGTSNCTEAADLKDFSYARRLATEPEFEIRIPLPVSIYSNTRIETLKGTNPQAPRDLLAVSNGGCEAIDQISRQTADKLGSVETKEQVGLIDVGKQKATEVISHKIMKLEESKQVAKKDLLSRFLKLMGGAVGFGLLGEARKNLKKVEALQRRRKVLIEAKKDKQVA